MVANIDQKIQSTTKKLSTVDQGVQELPYRRRKVRIKLYETVTARFHRKAFTKVIRTNLKFGDSNLVCVQARKTVSTALASVVGQRKQTFSMYRCGLR